MTKIKFFAELPEIPRTTHQQRGVKIVHGRPMFYTKDKVQEVKDLYTLLLRTHRPEQPLAGALRLVVKFYYPVRKPHKDGEPKTTRPDTDNMIKLLKDVATACGYWIDDAQIADERVVKAYSNPSGIWFEVEQIGQGGAPI